VSRAPDPDCARWGWRQDALLLAVLGAVLALLEWRHPYYFLQDDNRTSQLGLFVQYARGLASGELPLYDFHQFLGMPSFTVGSVALFYPPVYVAVWLSRALLGHPDATIDLLVALHLAIGLLGMRRLGRHLGLTAAAAAYAALTWPLSSMVVFSASSWWNVVGVVAFLPLTLLLALRLLAVPDAAAVARLVAVRGLLLYLGHVQLFVYATCFEVLCVLLAATAGPQGGARALLRRLAPYGLSLYLGAALALPMVEPLWSYSVHSTERAAPFPFTAFHDGSYSIVAWLQGAVDPWRADPDYYAAPIGYWRERVFPYLSFTGYLTLALLPALPLLRRAPAGRQPARVFVVPLLVAFLWTTGALDRWLYLVPVLNRFRWHFRVNVFVVFFLIVVAALVFTAVERRLAPRLGAARLRRLTAAALAVQLAGLVALYTLTPQRTFNHRAMAERPPLREPLAPLFADGRIVALGYRSADPYGTAQVGFDYASLWGLYQYAGYANLVSRQHARHVRDIADPSDRRPSHDGVLKAAAVPIHELRRWAVSWYVVGRDDEEPAATERYERQLARAGLQRVATDVRRTVWRDAHAEPLVALLDGDARQSLAPALSGHSLGVRFAPAPRPRRLVAAFLATPGLTAEDGNGRPLPSGPDAIERLVVTVPPGVAAVRIVHHEPELLRGTRHALALYAPVLLGWGWWRLRRRGAAPG
jgi:hypothetical protein